MICYLANFFLRMVVSFDQFGLVWHFKSDEDSVEVKGFSIKSKAPFYALYGRV